ncbi:sulfate adenylyltransferase subunit CysD [Pseudomonas sp. N040]|uniref:sulfate adenylyltransferase subunit CysD n=1 Tax=Pseudomonas sp. N040 TaxID=2785325 RepID=UPI0018A317F5|nr:sulfate adenylyltransferase subunit CysD [Pseudomonas sp. N040]MBF7731016.1 sulfate adenylyltransferase subunit CysD [Pseudomonas sp. N040]MBW7014659.1 sulfate adenylyltransferase subunit CysD [Pseudomonas sp. N040]
MANPDLLGLDAPVIWDTQSAFVHLQQLAQADTKRTAERRLHELALLPAELSAASLTDELGRTPTPAVLAWEIERARAKRKLVLFAQLSSSADGQTFLHANDARGARYWLPLGHVSLDAAQLANGLQQLQAHLGKDLVIFPSGRLTGLCRQTTPPDRVELGLLGYPALLDVGTRSAAAGTRRPLTPHLKRLEAESLQIIREALAESENPCMLYSMGKDSAVMLHLARKAFWPSVPPFPLLHVDTRWKFQEMYLFRDLMARESGMDLLVHVNPDAISKDINPFDHGSALHTDITKTEGLKQALDKYQFDLVFGGARRDEEKSRAKERIFSFRTQSHQWDPKQQRPELWNLYNTRKHRGESIRVFPLSNWTELDIWQYIYLQDIPLVPLYFARLRPVVERNGMLLLVDDARMRLLPDEKIEARTIRFRTLGCYPLTGAVESQAGSVAEIIMELLASRSSERQGRAIDSDSSASMEKKKQEGYF